MKSVKKYREHGQAQCSMCGRTGLVNDDSPLFNKGGGNFLGWCDVCYHWTGYQIDPLAYVEGDEVLVLSKRIDPEIGSYTEYIPESHGGVGFVVKVNDRGGVVVRSLDNLNHIAVYHEHDLARLIDDSEIAVSILNTAFDWDTVEEPLPAELGGEKEFIEWDDELGFVLQKEEFKPTPWYMKLFNYLMDRILGVF